MALSADDALNFSDPASTAMNGSLRDNLNQARAKYQTDLDSQQKQMQPTVDRFSKAASEPTPAVPEPKKPTAAPDQQEFQKDSQGWITALSAFSALIGARGRARGTGALKAYAAGAKGLQAGNQQAFENAYKTWKADSDAMFEENKQEMDKYKAILTNRSLTEQEAFDEIKMIGYEHQNKLMMDAKDFEQASAIYESAVKAEVGVKTYIAKMEQKKSQMDAEQAEQIEKYKADPSTGSLADAYHNGVPITTLVKGLGRDAQYKAQAIQDAATEKYGEFDWAEAHNKYMARGSELKGIGTMAGKVELGGLMLDKSIPSMLDAARKVGLTESTDLNTLYNAAKRHLSNQDFQNFSTQLRATTSDYALFLGRGRQTVHSDQEALRILNENMGINSLKGFRDAVAAERANTTSAINEALGRAPVKESEAGETPSLVSKYGLEP